MIGLNKGFFFLSFFLFSLLSPFSPFSPFSQFIFQSSGEEKFIFSLKSEIICESESITKPVATLVCDCLSGDGGFFSLSLSHFFSFFLFLPFFSFLFFFFFSSPFFSLSFLLILILFQKTPGEHCYVVGEQEKEVLMGFAAVCQGEPSFVKVFLIRIFIPLF